MATQSTEVGGVRPASEVLIDALASGIPAAIEPRFAHELTKQVAASRPKIALEIGMANGISTLAILAGLEPDARLISIDPYQDSEWQGRGVARVAQTNRAGSHSIRQSPDWLALPALLADSVEIDFAYIDGMHTFDYVALDAFYVDKLLRVGGVVGFNDCGFRSVHKFLRFFQQHRHYQEIDTGLAHDYRGANPLISLHRRLTGRSNHDRYFRKLDRWEPEHNFFRDF